MPRFLDKIMKPFGPKPPYTDMVGDKGNWRRFATAQAIDWTEHCLHPPGWHELPPLKIALLTDFHTGSHTDDLERISQIVVRVNDWQPDIVALGGDFVNTQAWGGGLIAPAAITEVIRPLQARLGAWAVLGNHDWSYGERDVASALEDAGVTVLENTSQLLEGSLWIGGVSDEKEGDPDVAQTLRDVPEGAPVLVLAHDPYTLHRMKPGPFLMLSGHTHGGQFCLPGGVPLVNASFAPLRWTKGHVVDKGRHVYVSRGIGTSFLPIRTFCSPEVALLTVGGAEHGTP